LARRADRVFAGRSEYFGENAKLIRGVVVVRCLSRLNAECQLKIDGGPVTADLVSGNYFSARRRNAGGTRVSRRRRSTDAPRGRS
jgi:hypothetical protein